MARIDPQVNIRIPEPMLVRIREDAEASRRSVSGQVLHYLDRVFAAERTRGPAEGATSPGRGPINTEERADEQHAD